jgi:hypothetical protein
MNRMEISMERLTEKCGNRWIPMQSIRNNGYDKCMAKLAEYEDAEEQGLLLRLPCKIGDKVFFIDENFDLKANGSSFLDCEVALKKIIASRKFDYYMIPDIGTKYFLTKETTEEVLKDSVYQNTL